MGEKSEKKEKKEKEFLRVFQDGTAEYYERRENKRRTKMEETCRIEQRKINYLYKIMKNLTIFRQGLVRRHAEVYYGYRVWGSVELLTGVR